MTASRVAALVSALHVLCGATANAETLEAAMRAAMRQYPPVLAEAARRKAAQAGIDVARAGYMPRVTATGDIGASSGNRGLLAGSGTSSLGSVGSPFGTDWTTRWGYSVMAEQPIFDGFRTRSAVSEAQAGAEAASAQVRVVEQLVLMEAVTVYADMLRDRDVEALRERDVAALAEQVASMRERAARGEASATDVAQARARHALAIAELITAKASVTARIADYARVIGRAPGKLVRPRPPDARLPANIEAVVASANANHPVAIAAGFKMDASRHAIDRQRADGLPQVKLRGGVEGDRAFSGASSAPDSASVSLRVAVPLFDGGETAARVEQARQISNSLAEESRGVRDRLQAGAVTAWTGLAAARERIAVERRAVGENEQAVAGLKEEIRLGQRSVIDLLDAQRDLVNARVRVAGSERELVVAAYALLSAAGLLRTPDPTRVDEPQASAAEGTGWAVKEVVRSNARREPGSKSLP